MFWTPTSAGEVPARVTTDRADGDASTEEVVAVGRIGKAHGIRGDVFVEPWTDAADERFSDGTVLRSESGQRFTVEASRLHSGKLVVHFEGLDDRNAVEAVRGTVLMLPASARPPIEDPDEFYDTDLIGLAVRTLDDQQLGPVTDVLHSPAGSLLAVDVAGREVLVPFRLEFVPTVDLTAGIVVIDPPDGLLDL
jgi:16S rRNA processing protein RimM